MKTIRISNTDIPLSLSRATVIHANKYAESHGGAFNLPVSSTLYTEVVFRDKNTNEHLQTRIRDLDLPVYTEQEVTLLLTGKLILAFADLRTSYYYYTTRDFSRKLGIGMGYWWIWIIGIAGGLLLFILLPSEKFILWFVPLFGMWLFYSIQKWRLNRQIKKAIDQFMRA